MRLIALGLLFLACGLTGVFLSRGLQLRVRELEAILRLLGVLRAQMQFSRAPLGPMLSQACAQGQSPAFLPGCLERLGAGRPFPEAWRLAVERGGGPRPDGLRPEDRRLLLSLGELLGSTDADGQREGLLLHEELARQLLESARQRRDTQGRAFFTLGVLSGLTLVILLI